MPAKALIAQYRKLWWPRSPLHHKYFSVERILNEEQSSFPQPRSWACVTPGQGNKLRANSSSSPCGGPWHCDTGQKRSFLTAQSPPSPPCPTAKTQCLQRAGIAIRFRHVVNSGFYSFYGMWASWETTHREAAHPWSWYFHSIVYGFFPSLAGYLVQAPKLYFPCFSCLSKSDKMKILFCLLI